mgnify:CR=1 FL=1
MSGFNLENSYTQLPPVFYTNVTPTPVSSPRMVIFNRSQAENLGLKPDELEGDKGAEVFSGNKPPIPPQTIAQAYAGHQFGYFTILGDGRALLLGEQITPDGQRFDLQLKGSGPTPYSRGGDGRAALGPMLREYMISEAMFFLGIPTTRSLAVVVTGDPVYRELPLAGAILTRVAASHIRVGTFQFAAQHGDLHALQSLANYTIKRHFPQIKLSEENDAPGKKADNTQAYLLLLKEVIQRQASLIAEWQRVGFIHGVMNTDNMTISGETIDYGPCAFMDTYHPRTVFSSIDRQGRYAYSNQPTIGGWNLSRFAETLIPLLHREQSIAIKMAQDELDRYTKLFNGFWLHGMRSKLGLFNQEPSDEAFIRKLLKLMEDHQLDFTNTFIELIKGNQPDVFGFDDWWHQWQQRMQRQPQSKDEVLSLMKKSNPFVIPRNHQVEAALTAAVDKSDLTPLQDLMNVLSNPYDHSSDKGRYTAPPPPSNTPYRTYCGT